MKKYCTIHVNIWVLHNESTAWNYTQIRTRLMCYHLFQMLSKFKNKVNFCHVILTMMMKGQDFLFFKGTF